MPTRLLRKAVTRNELEATIYPILLLFLSQDLIPLVVEYRGFYLRIGEMTDLYHRIGMDHENHRKKDIIFDPPETWWHFRQRIGFVMEGPARYACVLFDFGSLEPDWVCIYHHDPHSLNLLNCSNEYRYCFHIFCSREVRERVNDCFQTLDHMELYYTAWNRRLFPSYSYDETGIESLGIAVYLAYRHENLKKMDDVDIRDRGCPKLGPLVQIVLKDSGRDPFPFRTYCWEMVTSRKPAHGSLPLIVSFKGELCHFSSSAALLGIDSRFPLWKSDDVKCISSTYYSKLCYKLC